MNLNAIVLERFMKTVFHILREGYTVKSFFQGIYEMQFQGHFMKYEILSWNTFTSLSKIHRVMFLFNKKIVKDIVKRSQRRYSVKFSRKGTM